MLFANFLLLLIPTLLLFFTNAMAFEELGGEFPRGIEQFFSELKLKQVKEFVQIVRQSNVTIEELKTQLETFAKGNGVLDAYNAVNALKNKVLDAAPQNLAGPTLASFNQIKEIILANDTLTRGEKCDKIHVHLNGNGTDANVRYFLPRVVLFPCLGIGYEEAFEKKIFAKFSKLEG